MGGHAKVLLQLGEDSICDLERSPEQLRGGERLGEGHGPGAGQMEAWGWGAGRWTYLGDIQGVASPQPVSPKPGYTPDPPGRF